MIIENIIPSSKNKKRNFKEMISQIESTGKIIKINYIKLI